MSNNIAANSIARSASFEASGLEVPQCYCRLDAVWRKVSKEGANHGRHFWGCPRFGQADDEQKCRFFQWADEELVNFDQGGLGKTTPNSVDRHIPLISSPTSQDVNASSASQRRVRFVQLQSEESLPTVVDDDDLHVITGRSSNGLENTHTPLGSPRSNSSNYVTPPKIKNYKYYQPTSTSENPSPLPRIIANPKQRNVLTTSDNGIPRFTTPELLEVVENHMNQQDRFGACQELSKDLAREEIRQLRTQTDQIMKEMEFTKRENQLLKGEKRVLERDLEAARQELRELKRRKGDQ